MDQQLETAFLAALEESQHRLLRVCSVYAADSEDKKDLFQEESGEISELKKNNTHPSLRSRPKSSPRSMQFVCGFSAKQNGYSPRSIMAPSFFSLPSMS